MKRMHESVTGAAVVEFAFVLPVLLLLFFGIIEFSVALYDKAILTNASREAARAGAMYIGPSIRLTDEQIRTLAIANCGDNMITFRDDAAPVVTITRTTHPDFSQQLLTVRLDYSYTGLGLGAMLTSITGPVDISASTTMKNE